METELLLFKIVVTPAALLFSVLGCVNIRNNNDDEVSANHCNIVQMFLVKRSQTDSEDGSEESEEEDLPRPSGSGDKKKISYRPANDNETVDAFASNWDKPVENPPTRPTQQQPGMPMQQQPMQQTPQQPRQSGQPAKTPSSRRKRKHQLKTPKDAGYVYNEKAFFALPKAKDQQGQQDNQPADAGVSKGSTPQQQQQQRKHQIDPKTPPVPKGMDPYFYKPVPKP